VVVGVSFLFVSATAPVDLDDHLADAGRCAEHAGLVVPGMLGEWLGVRVEMAAAQVE
jgi:hypothetical protein